MAMAMAMTKAFLLFLLFRIIFLAESKCPSSFNCGSLGPLEFPLSDQPGCGLFLVNCSTTSFPSIQFGTGGVWYSVLQKLSTNKFKLLDPFTGNHLNPGLRIDKCLALRNSSVPTSPFSSFTIISPVVTIFSCSNPLEYFDKYYKYTLCDGVTLYYRDENYTIPSNIPENCSIVRMPRKSDQESYGDDLFAKLTPEFELEWNVSAVCVSCNSRGRKCVISSGDHIRCEEKSRKTKIILASTLGTAAFLGLCSVLCFIIYRRTKRSKDSYLISRNMSFDPSSRSEIEGGSLYFGIPIFSYKELEKATSNFDSLKELGDGGFGTVYYGKLGDGREVAIKRLYEHNYKRVEQFINEIKILTCLRHPNLVSLYGCTSRTSRELLLVYEYISNGTVADHLHGDRAREALLTWSIRMSIAIETAGALAYLHNSDIIHRDVKTNNILLDNNFSVKVADFGLSRLFPNDVTHISTAPQGTPGYVDPEYHQCYQLTDKSDVYSFGVVLIELISSMPAVDITRHRHEINLANLAMNRIQKCAFDKLIDPSLGYESNAEVTRMTTSVAELAFRCLQLEKDLRPSMEEVLESLKDIQGGGDWKLEKVKGFNGKFSMPPPGKIPPSPESDDAILLKKKRFQSSPTAVTDAWASSGSTTVSSIG